MSLPWSTIPSGWALYHETLAELPIDVLDDAIKAHLADPERGRWFPLPADIMAKAADEMAWRREQAYRARRAAEPLALPAPEMSAEERASISAGFAKLLADLRAKLSMPIGVDDDEARPVRRGRRIDLAGDRDPNADKLVAYWTKEMGLADSG